MTENTKPEVLFDDELDIPQGGAGQQYLYLEGIKGESSAEVLVDNFELSSERAPTVRVVPAKGL